MHHEVGTVSASAAATTGQQTQSRKSQQKSARQQAAHGVRRGDHKRWFSLRQRTRHCVAGRGFCRVCHNRIPFQHATRFANPVFTPKAAQQRKLTVHLRVRVACATRAPFTSCNASRYSHGALLRSRARSERLRFTLSQRGFCPCASKSARYCHRKTRRAPFPARLCPAPKWTCAFLPFSAARSRRLAFRKEAKTAGVCA